MGFVSAPRRYLGCGRSVHGACLTPRPPRPPGPSVSGGRLSGRPGSEGAQLAPVHGCCERLRSHLTGCSGRGSGGGGSEAKPPRDDDDGRWPEFQPPDFLNAACPGLVRFTQWNHLVCLLLISQRRVKPLAEQNFLFSPLVVSQPRARLPLFPSSFLSLFCRPFVFTAAGFSCSLWPEPDKRGRAAFQSRACVPLVGSGL